MPAIPRPAATVILLRDAPDSPEVLLLVRKLHERDPYAGASVFPGGVVDDHDSTTQFPSAPDFGSVGINPEIPPQQVHAFLAAACRELFEEAGILIARHASGAVVAPGIVAELSSERHRLQAGKISLRDLLEPRGLLPDPSEFVSFAHWITPEAQKKRWDTYFFVAPAPADQPASSDGYETTHAEWISPRSALQAYRAGSITLTPPTFWILEDLSRHPNRKAVFDWARKNAPPAMILPVPLRDTPIPTFVYPGDSEYPGAPDCPGRNRVLLDQGRWRSERG